jgi:hypothetical protein
LGNLKVSKTPQICFSRCKRSIPKPEMQLSSQEVKNYTILAFVDDLFISHSNAFRQAILR